MRPLSEWLNEYSNSHQNPTNQFIHKICVPLIYFSVVALLWCVPLPNGWSFSFVDNVFWLVIIPILAFYFALGVKAFIVMLGYNAVCCAVLYGLELVGFQYILQLAVVIFIIAWIMQFWGHKIEGAKPSFINDLVFLLIGPLWVFKRIL